MESEFIPNLELVNIKACEILLESKLLKSFPFNPWKLIEEMSDIVFCSYGAAKMKGISRSAWLSDDAEFLEYQGMSIIFYNETVKDSHRLAFSILHEFGHYYLQHDMTRFEDTNNNKLLHKLYNRYEQEANFFAAQLLMPKQILRALKLKGLVISQDFLVKKFNVSRKAAERKQDYVTTTAYLYKNVVNDIYYDIITKKFSVFINSLIPVNNEYQFSLENNIELENKKVCCY